MANNCPNCGAALLNGATSCTFCGAVIPAEQPVYSAEQGNNSNAGYDQNQYNQSAGYDQNQYNQNAAYGQNQYNQSTGYDQNQYNQNAAYDQNQYNQNAAYGQNQYSSNQGYAQAQTNGYGAPGVNVNVYAQMPASNIRMKTNRSMVAVILLSLITFGIYGLYFWSVLGEDVNMICSRRDGKKQMHYLIATLLLSGITLGIVPLVWITTLSSRVGEEARSRGIQTSFGGASFWLWSVLGVFIIVGPFIYLYKLCHTMNLICEDYNRKGY